MRTCVTGGAGFIGSSLVDRLVCDGHDVIVLDDLSTGRIENLRDVREHMEFIEGDLRDEDAVRRAVKGCDVVFHQAALAAVARSVEKPELVTDVNVRGTVNVLVAARDAGARRVVMASSSSIYGDTPELPKHEAMTLSPRSPYAASKACGEVYFEAFQASYGLETVALRYFNVYGRRQSPRSLYAAVVPLFIEAFSQGRQPTIYGDGEQTRDFTYIDDVVEANWKAAIMPRAPEGPMNIGGGSRISINELARTIAASFGVTCDPVYEPTRVGDVRDSLADITHARTRLEWAPSTALADGIAVLVESARADLSSTPS